MLSKLPKLEIWITLIVMLFLIPKAEAQLSDRKNNIQVYASGISYKGELGSQFWRSFGLGGGVAYNRYLSPSFDFSTSLSYGKSDCNFENNDYFDNRIGLGLVGLKLKMRGTILEENAIIGPYLSIMGGAMYVDSKGAAESVSFGNKFVTAAFMPGAGFTVRVTNGLSIFSEVSYILTGNDSFDGITASDNDSFLEYKLGLGFNLGKGRDLDKDGIPDIKDKCPGTPTGVQVNKDGCPIDTDGDGVADYQDNCPTEAGVANLGGCPDRDGDGIADKEDQCPDEAGTAATNGCPDTDGDGVADKDDKCPDTPAGVQVGPDGCPVDSDGDGVPDNEDLCPNSAGTAENKGCPELDARTRKLLEEKARFEFDQARVQDVYKGLLDSIVITLTKYPDHILLINGHADYIGSEEYNQELSEKRAQAVKDYLIERGVQNPDRLVVKGFGESQPLIKINTRLSKQMTERERALNRRVGFELNTPELKLNLK